MSSSLEDFGVLGDTSYHEWISNKAHPFSRKDREAHDVIKHMIM